MIKTVEALINDAQEIAERLQEAERKAMETAAEKPPMVVQSLILSKEEFPEEKDAVKWAKDHGYDAHGKPGVEETEDSWRIRQRPPSDFDPKSFRTIDLDKGVKAVAGHLKGKGEEIPAELKTFDFALKEMGATPGEFHGLAAVYGNVDRQGDQIEPGAFTRTGNALGWEVPLLWQHDVTRPIGVGKIEDHPKGLKIHGFLNLGVGVAREAYELMKPAAGFTRGVIRGLSIGYDVMKDAVEGGIRKLKEIKLWEVSLVTFPANGRALVSDVKQAQFLSDRVSLLDAKIEELKRLLTEEGYIDPGDAYSILSPRLAAEDANSPDEVHLFAKLAEEMKAFDLLWRLRNERTA